MGIEAPVTVTPVVVVTPVVTVTPTPAPTSVVFGPFGTQPILKVLPSGCTNGLNMTAAQQTEYGLPLIFTVGGVKYIGIFTQPDLITHSIPQIKGVMVYSG